MEKVPNNACQKKKKKKIEENKFLKIVKFSDKLQAKRKKKTNQRKQFKGCKGHNIVYVRVYTSSIKYI